MTDFWFIDLIGRMHPLMVHFPIGLLIAAFLLELWSVWKRKEQDLRPVIYMGAAGAVLASLMGQFLYWTQDYAGELIDDHQLMGIITAILSLFAAYVYWKKDKFPQRLPLLVLVFSCLALTLAGHLGASITHGENYLSDAFPKEESLPSEQLAQFASWKESDSLSTRQLDKLNLQVRAIFAHRCYQCHSTAKRKGGLALDDRDAVFEGGENGPIIQIGNPAESEIIRRLRLSRSNKEAMPPKGKLLNKAEIDLIALWINKGAHWADESLKIFREAEMALHKPELPAINGEIKHPIDRFLDVYFEQHAFDWPELVSDRKFVRRAYLDITGLLPSSSEIEAFVSNKDLKKREKLLDTLLEDRQNYALHWLSFWNDLLRNDYTGTGFITGGRRRITDWLYQALFEGKSYQNMVSELINPTSESEGFIKGIKWRGVVNSSQRTELQAAQNISQSLLGLNLKCASCHDSFVNNVSLDQAYNFANIFADTLLEIHRCDKPTGRFASPAFIYPELGEVDAESIKERLEQLSQVIITPENGRLYRTIVNRYWDQLFGRGIVAPTDEMDNIPWNQELLDWLAADFIEHGYDLKHLLKRIMSSRAYQLPAQNYPSENYLLSEKFAFKGPLARRLSAEQFADALSQLLSPLYHGAAFLPEGEEFPAKWIWYRDIEVDRTILPKPGIRYFRKKISLKNPSSIQEAELLITADHAFELYLNEELLIEGADWTKVKRVQIALESLKRKNIFAIKAENEGSLPNPAGVLFALRIKDKYGKESFTYSDRSWLSQDSLSSEDWRRMDHEEEDWEPVIARSSGHYWGKLPDFSFEEKELDIPFLRASMVAQENFMKTLGRPSRENVSTKRDKETTLLQALMLSNDEFLHEKISKGAAAWMQKSEHDPVKLLQALYASALGREISHTEQKLLLDKIEGELDQEVVEDWLWALLLLPEFQFI